MEHWWNDIDRGNPKTQLICITYLIENTMIAVDDCSRPTGKQKMFIVRITWNTNIQCGQIADGLLLR
jgi:hypothetical protein